MISKGCPKCEQQVPVARKACSCGHQFFNARKSTKVGSSGVDTSKRPQRVRREKPNYYDVLEYDKEVKKAKLRNSECENEEDKKGLRVKRRRMKMEAGYEEPPVQLSPEKQLLCSVILAEINRKLQLVTWKPPE